MSTSIRSTKVCASLMAAAGLALVWATPARADTVIFQNLQQMVGEIVQDTDHDIVLKVEFGTIHIEKEKILKIEKETAEDLKQRLETEAEDKKQEEQARAKEKEKERERLATQKSDEEMRCLAAKEAREERERARRGEEDDQDPNNTRTNTKRNDKQVSKLIDDIRKKYGKQNTR